MSGSSRGSSARLSTILRRSLVGVDGLEGEAIRAAAIAFALEAENPQTPPQARNVARREALAAMREYAALIASRSRRDVVTDIRSRVS